MQRPPVNAVDLTLAREFERVVGEAAEDADCRALVLTGAPGCFCGGIDVRALPAYDDATRAELLRTVNRMLRAFYGLPKPVVGAVSGHALGAGFVLALACDARFLARGDAKLGLTEAAAGVPFPAAPLEVVRAELSPELARRLVLPGIVLGPEDPRIGSLVDGVVAPETLLDVALEDAGRLAALPAFGAVKRQLRAPALARLDAIVEAGEEPLLQGWLDGIA